jgi:6-methylsalicylate decarboxylase
MTTPEPLLTDVHAHFLTDSYVAAAVAAGHTTPDGMPSWPTWSADEHLALMDGTGVERSLLSISSPGVHFGDDAAARTLARQTNLAAAEVAAGRADRFGHLAILPLPDVDGAVAEACRALDEEGAGGVVLLSNAGGVYPGAAALDPLFAELDARGALVLLHPTAAPHVEEVALGRPLPMIEFLFDSARAVTDLLFADRIRRHPRIRWVITHGGGVLPLLTDRLDLFSLLEPPAADAAPRCDTKEALARCWFDSAGTPLPTQLPTLAATVGAGDEHWDRLVFGSDFCFTPAPVVAAQAMALREWRPRFVAGTAALMSTADCDGRLIAGSDLDQIGAGA